MDIDRRRLSTPLQRALQRALAPLVTPLPLPSALAAFPRHAIRRAPQQQEIRPGTQRAIDESTCLQRLLCRLNLPQPDRRTRRTVRRSLAFTAPLEIDRRSAQRSGQGRRGAAPCAHQFIDTTVACC